MSGTRRRRRASLRGWWRTLPFVFLLGATLSVFTWLHTQCLRNEYRANKLANEIQRVKDRIGDLRGERYDLGSLERMKEAAPKHALVEPRPGQIRILDITREEMAALRDERVVASPPVRMTRSVVVRIDGLAPAVRVPDASTTVAQRAPTGAEDAAGHF